MARILVIHYTEKGRLPKLTPEQQEEINERLAKALEENPEVKCKGVYVDAEGIGVCEWEAPDAKIVEKIVRDVIKAPYDKVVLVEEQRP